MALPPAEVTEPRRSPPPPVEVAASAPPSVNVSPRQPSRVRPSTSSPLSRWCGEKQVRFDLEFLVRALANVKWFSSLPDTQLRRLVARGRLERCGRYRTIIREGTRGAYFYVLLKGKVHCTSQIKKGLSVKLNEGASFGEGALVTTVQREATVTALEGCQLMLFTAEDMEGLDVELRTVRCHVISLMLEKIRFFRDLTKVQQNELSQIMEMSYLAPSSVLFEEDDPGDAMYIVLEGSVDMIKRSDDDRKLATFTSASERPWFGEVALLGQGKKRTCAVVCAEMSKLLVVRLPDFTRFLEIVPSFNAMFMTSAQAYKELNMIRQKLTSNDDVLNVVSSMFKGSMGGSMFGEREETPSDDDEDFSEELLSKWESLTEKLVERADCPRDETDRFIEDDANAIPGPRTGPTGGRRRSYVAGHSINPSMGS